MKIEKVKYIFLSKNKIKLDIQLNYLKVLQIIYMDNYKEENFNILNEDIKKVFSTTEY